MKDSTHDMNKAILEAWWENKMWTIIVESPFHIKPYQVYGRSSKNFGIDYALQIIECYPYEVKENKMTRDEAICKLKNVKNDSGHLTFSAAALVDGLEALGLIKFEEKKSMEDVVTTARMVGPYEEFIAELDKHGYKIVSK